MTTLAQPAFVTDKAQKQILGKVADLPVVATPLPLRFLKRVLFLASGCWIWTGPTACNPTYRHQRYGIFDWRVAGKRFCSTAHRVSYAALVGAIPTGLELDHLCENKLCVNPAHLEAVTHRENIIRSYQRRKP